MLGARVHRLLPGGSGFPLAQTVCIVRPMLRRAVTLGGWIALGASTAFASGSANATPRPQPSIDLDIAAPANPAVNVWFILMPSHGGTRTLVLADDMGRLTSLGDVPPLAVCETLLEPQWEESASYVRPAKLSVGCGGGLGVEVWADGGLLHFRGAHADGPDARSFKDSLALPAGATVVMDETLADPALAPTCLGERGAIADVTMRREMHEYMGELRVHVAGVPIEGRIDLYGDETCTGTRDPDGAHYQIECMGQAHAQRVEMEVRDGALLMRTGERAPCTGFTDLLGGWRLPCGARLGFPEGTNVRRYGEYGFVEDEEGGGG
jgi:hypothetical protein